MKIVITAAGSRGDVDPYTGLGAALAAAGHEVVVAATEGFEGMVREAGLGFRGLPGQPAAAAGSDRRGDGLGKRELMRTASEFITELGRGFAAAVDADADLLLLSATTAPLGWHLAEARNVPCFGVSLQPAAPTGDFPPVVGGTRSLGRFGNRAAGRLALRMTDRLFAPAVGELRAVLGLPALSASAMRARQEEARWPVFHGFSTALVPRPADWHAGLEVVGNWWPYVSPERKLPAELRDFLQAGPPPVFVGFGSMASGRGERLAEITLRALRRAGLRGVLQAGSAGLDAAGDDVLSIGDVPHALLFPHVAAVVHHAGAGTAAAALRAGVPAVPVPVTADQPFWAGRVAAIGASPSPIPFRDLTAERLATALGQAAGEPGCRQAAEQAAERIRAEDGAGQVVKAVERSARR